MFVRVSSVQLFHPGVKKNGGNVCCLCWRHLITLFTHLQETCGTNRPIFLAWCTHHPRLFLVRKKKRQKKSNNAKKTLNKGQKNAKLRQNNAKYIYFSVDCPQLNITQIYVNLQSYMHIGKTTFEYALISISICRDSYCLALGLRSGNSRICNTFESLLSQFCDDVNNACQCICALPQTTCVACTICHT